MENRNCVAALDLGGTNMRVGIIDPDGKIVKRARHATPSIGSADDVISAIVGLITKCIGLIVDDLRVAAVAAAVPATFKQDGGILSKLPNMPMLDGVDLAGELQRRIGLPVFLTNDATAATYGENWKGASVGFENVIGITLGTGVGGGLIISGELYSGPDGTAGEIGHMCVEPNGIDCGCGSNGCVEQYAAGKALVREAIAAGLNVDSPKGIFELAVAGDKVAMKVFANMGRYLGIATAAAINLLNPDVVVIGGGVSNAWPLFVDALKCEVKKRAFREPAERANIIRAELGDDAGILGAARIAFNRLG